MLKETKLSQFRASCSGVSAHVPNVRESAMANALKEAISTVTDASALEVEQEPWWRQGSEMGPFREAVANVVFSRIFEGITMTIIVFNLVLVVIQTDSEALCFPQYRDDWKNCPTKGDNILWMEASNLALVIYYSSEAVAKLFVARCPYFKRWENIFDFVICVIGILGEIFGSIINLSWLRIFRLWRLVRLLNSISDVQEVHMLITGLGGALRAMIYGTMMLFFALLLASICVVQFIHPIAVDIPNCDRCGRGFSSVYECIKTLFQQIVAGDSWGAISLPVLDTSPIVGMWLPFVQLIVSMGLMNLILAVVVDRAMEQRETSKEIQLAKRRAEQEARKVRLLNIISAYDHDFSGTLSRDEILEACTSSNEIRMILEETDLKDDELQHMLDHLENESDGEISYARLVNFIHDIEAADLRKLAVLSFTADSFKHAEHAKMLAYLTDSLQRIESTTSKLFAMHCGLDHPLPSQAHSPVEVGEAADGNKSTTRDSKAVVARFTEEDAHIFISKAFVAERVTRGALSKLVSVPEETRSGLTTDLNYVSHHLAQLQRALLDRFDCDSVSAKSQHVENHSALNGIAADRDLPFRDIAAMPREPLIPSENTLHEFIRLRLLGRSVVPSMTPREVGTPRADQDLTTPQIPMTPKSSSRGENWPLENGS